MSFRSFTYYLRFSPSSQHQGLHLDPLLDESVHMAKRFKALGMQVSLDLVDDLPHGFLNFMHLSKEAYHASLLCGLRIKRLLSAARRNRLASSSSISSFCSVNNDLKINVNMSDFPSKEDNVSLEATQLFDSITSATSDDPLTANSSIYELTPNAHPPTQPPQNDSHGFEPVVDAINNNLPTADPVKEASKCSIDSYVSLRNSSLNF